MADAHLFLLPRAIASVKNQTVPAEILIVNDGTPVLPDMDAGSFHLLNTGGQKGSAYARNLGLDCIQTPYTLFLDADDILLDTAVETLSLAMDEYETCYVYSDWYQYRKDGQLVKTPAKNYDRTYLLRHSVHLVNILIPTDIAKMVYYDTNYRGWEDWAFHIELGLRGFCGQRYPEPLLVYDMTTSINREAHNKIADEVYNEIRTKYSDYIEGGREFMACTGCGNNKPRMNLTTAVPPPAMDGMVVMEYMGENIGAIGYRVGKNVYRGANDQANKFAQVYPQDVQALMDKGPWRRVPKIARPATVPLADEFNQWREMNQTETPANWADLFKKDAVILDPPKVVEEPPKQKRHRRTKAEMDEARRLANAEPATV